jgi:hypothetical protein
VLQYEKKHGGQTKDDKLGGTELSHRLRTLSAKRHQAQAKHDDYQNMTDQQPWIERLARQHSSDMPNQKRGKTEPQDKRRCAEPQSQDRLRLLGEVGPAAIADLTLGAADLRRARGDRRRQNRLGVSGAELCVFRYAIHSGTLLPNDRRLYISRLTVGRIDKFDDYISLAESLGEKFASIWRFDGMRFANGRKSQHVPRARSSTKVRRGNRDTNAGRQCDISGQTCGALGK